MELKEKYKKIDTIYITISALFIILTLFSVSIPISFQIYFFCIGSIIIGLPHGALDYEVAKYLGLCKTEKGKKVFFLSYIFVTFLVFGIWVIYPELAFSLFLFVSLWHFGQDWHLGLFKNLRVFAFGLGFISLPSLNHPVILESIFSFLVPNIFAANLIFFLNVVAILTIPAIIIFIFIDLIQNIKIIALRSSIFLLSALYLQPLMFLFLYFCIFHSPRHTLEIYNALEYKSFSVMFKSQLPILVISIMLIIGLFLFQSEISQNDTNLFKSFIIFIASVTIPHMVLVEYFKFKKNRYNILF